MATMQGTSDVGVQVLSKPCDICGAQESIRGEFNRPHYSLLQDSPAAHEAVAAWHKRTPLSACWCLVHLREVTAAAGRIHDKRLIDLAIGALWRLRYGAPFDGTRLLRRPAKRTRLPLQINQSGDVETGGAGGPMAEREDRPAPLAATTKPGAEAGPVRVRAAALWLWGRVSKFKARGRRKNYAKGGKD